MPRLLSLLGRGVVPALALIFASGQAAAQGREAGDVVIKPGVVRHSGQDHDVEFGGFWVPMNRDDPDSSLIELQFVRYKSTSTDPAAPAVYLAGGPGGSGIGTMESTRARVLLALLDERDFIAFDQRGTGRSEPRDLRFAPRLQLPLDEQADAETYCEIARDSARRVLAGLQQRGIDPWGLTTQQSADDLDDLRKAVNAEKLVLWGSSYGTHLALAAARRHPDGIAALILAGTEGPDHTFKLPGNIQANLQRLGQLVAQDPVYAPLMPDFVATVEQVLEDLHRQPRTLTIVPGLTVAFGMWDLQQSLSGPMGSRRTMQEIPAAIYAMSHGEYFRLATLTVGERRVGGYSAMSLLMDCASYATAQRLEHIEQEASRTLLGAAIDFPFPCVCEVESMPRLGDDFRAPLRSDIPALFISGTVDGRTPISNAEEIAKGFTNHQHLIIRGASHGGDLFTSSPVIVESVKLFLAGETLPAKVVDGPAWSFEPPYRKSLEREMLEILTGEGYEAAVARYREIREQFEGTYVYDFREVVLNELGYAILQGGVTDPDLALDVFRLNTVAYPQAFNTWDSLAEGYFEKGDHGKAVEYYEKSLQLNPDNDNARRMLDRIRQRALE